MSWIVGISAGDAYGMPRNIIDVLTRSPVYGRVESVGKYEHIFGLIFVDFVEL